MMWWRESRFWTLGIAGFSAMFLVSLWQLGWLPYLRYISEWSHVEWLSLDIALAFIVSLLAGWNVGVVALLIPVRPVAARSGVLGAVGASLGTIAFACVGCYGAAFSVFGIAIGTQLIQPWLPVLRFASLALLLISTYLLSRKLRSPSCSR